MSNCANQTLGGLPKDCATSRGGVKNVWITNYDAVTGKTVTDGKVVEIAGADWKRYHFKPQTASMTSTLTVDAANGVNYVTTDLVLSFLRMETVKRIEMSALSVNELMIAVEDANGTFYLLGMDEPVTASAGTGETGTARGDGNKYTITLQDTSETFPFELDATLAETLKTID